jgi:hypothetical protein
MGGTCAGMQGQDKMVGHTISDRFGRTGKDGGELNVDQSCVVRSFCSISWVVLYGWADLLFSVC